MRAPKEYVIHENRTDRALHLLENYLNKVSPRKYPINRNETPSYGIITHQKPTTWAEKEIMEIYVDNIKEHGSIHEHILSFVYHYFLPDIQAWLTDQGWTWKDSNIDEEPPYTPDNSEVAPDVPTYPTNDCSNGHHQHTVPTIQIGTTLLK